MLFAQLSTDGSLYPAMFEITGGIPEPIFDEPQEAESLGRTWQALIGSQTLRRRSSTRYEREREIRLNGIGGVIFRNPDRNFGPGFLSLRIQSSIFGDPLSWFFHRTVIPNEMKGSQLHHDCAR